MARLSGLPASIRVRLAIAQPFIIFCLFVISCFAFSGKARAQQDNSAMPAEEIIQILQQNPDLLAEAKTQIVSTLGDRGYAVTQSDITDDRLFSEIRSD